MVKKTDTDTTDKWAQDEKELDQMAEFYSKQYGPVYFVRCLAHNHVIAVEVPMAGGGNTGRNREIFGYQGLLLSTRIRLDKTPEGNPMIGYECLCGNDTRLAAVERAEVPTSRVVKNKAGEIIHAENPPQSLSPFEREQIRTTVALKQASAGPADYERTESYERFETFQIERIK